MFRIDGSSVGKRGPAFLGKVRGAVVVALALAGPAWASLACGGDPLTTGDGAVGQDGGAGNDGGGAGADGGGGGMPKFSFFVTSWAALRELSGSEDGFGGDLRFGETGPGAGLRGADKICTTIAEKSMPGSGAKGWRAFLSVAKGPEGVAVHAIDRVGAGPWYDRRGRLLAPDQASLMKVRPEGGDPAIRDDLPNEDGVPNHRPDPTKPEDDNHHMLTGSNDTGRLRGPMATCLDWTSAKGDRTSEGQPQCGLSWPRTGGPGGVMAKHWIAALPAPGCAPGAELVQSGPADPDDRTVGGGGGYGGFYCFALVP